MRARRARLLALLLGAAWPGTAGAALITVTPGDPLEYNWIARPSSYPGDVMSCNTQCGASGTAPVTQKMLLRGNVIIQGNPLNLSQLIALYNDEPGGSYDGSGATAAMDLTLEHNTVVGTAVGAGKTQRLVNMRNDSGIATSLHLSNNVIYQVASLWELGNPGASNWSVDGKNNWVTTGTVGSAPGLSGTIAGASPGFVDAASKNFTLAASSACRGKAAVLGAPPTKEYFRDEAVKLQWRSRAGASDLGAFEHGTASSPVGPYGPPGPAPDAGPKPDGPAAQKDAAPPKKDAAPAKQDRLSDAAGAPDRGSAVADPA